MGRTNFDSQEWGYAQVVSKAQNSDLVQYKDVGNGFVPLDMLGGIVCASVSHTYEYRIPTQGGAGPVTDQSTRREQ